ncbi:molybdopterin-binding protein [Corynebacterium propinquum]|uniref:molybdopterin-binding protein n=1 Tax=Corynebacterium propinquum TaxID=43769 RepID=UPI00037274D1|nr:molybdopterin-binding protein [Corynebacterium propinquum]QQU91628.1 molybdopterin biosynthesis protein MoeB [Corynebacterium propinquum]WKS33560.1 molybdopterin-binding protein [Corynebacterium propinquum]WKS39990.1 molybdopterin-binding protein [Corynebacterium propinquum]WKS49838.1 molybdopterin-binding protein [Corynebacterium propinquum]
MGTKLAAIIVSSDRILTKGNTNKSGEIAQDFIKNYGLQLHVSTVIAEGYTPVDGAVQSALADGCEIIIVIGGTGIGSTNFTPEVTEKYLSARLHGLETQVLLRGLQSSPKAGLSRGIIGMTEHGGGSLIINCASSSGAVTDTLSVVFPLLPDIFRDCTN